MARPIANGADHVLITIWIKVTWAETWFHRTRKSALMFDALVNKGMIDRVTMIVSIVVAGIVIITIVVVAVVVANVVGPGSLCIAKRHCCNCVVCAVASFKLPSLSLLSVLFMLPIH